MSLFISGSIDEYKAGECNQLISLFFSPANAWVSGEHGLQVSAGKRKPGASPAWLLRKRKTRRPSAVRSTHLLCGSFLPFILVFYRFLFKSIQKKEGCALEKVDSCSRNLPCKQCNSKKLPFHLNL